MRRYQNGFYRFDIFSLANGDCRKKLDLIFSRTKLLSCNGLQNFFNGLRVPEVCNVADFGLTGQRAEP